jgi:peptidoglycan/xylan/chitin deacetylase (PgdA/CDA1 family)
MRVVGGLLVGLILLGGGLLGFRQVVNARAFQFFGGIVARVETDERVVALTFDDGPVPGRTDEILAILGRQGVPATFFLIGEQMAAHPAEARAIAAAGHEIGNHSWSHRRMIFRSPGWVGGELDRANAEVRRTGYTGEIAFRPPYGDKLLVLPWELRQRGMTTVMTDVEPDSFPDVAASAEGIVAHAVARTRPGSIILLHPWYASRATSFAAIEPLIAALKADGYRFATVADLLALDAR